MATTKNTAEEIVAIVLQPDQLLQHCMGHRNLTRRVIEAFPEDKLLSHSIGGMRPFVDMVREIAAMCVMGMQGLITGKWDLKKDAKGAQDYAPEVKSKKELLALWDESTEKIKKTWKELTPEKFQESAKMLGKWEAPTYSHIFYFIDNEIHHRGQGYVYLRSLGVEPPLFPDRS